LNATLKSAHADSLGRIVSSKVEFSGVWRSLVAHLVRDQGVSGKRHFGRCVQGSASRAV